ncbi:xanthine dehydrogenase/oxidase [Sugiyamaella lignohabitans]|uniref:xanthine dehydrogenase n=1 Tax=Sugiyamaella lignohabitans TaxID=796027 RepID=A0A167C240_9ASCO|nr:xanthine dehydrogenase/oxidase [Sugiyamaella lignohabitans]ANB11129.1 xanthine dehydrogenase/oxidase [Sugiyamaella lignohabitans]
MSLYALLRNCYNRHPTQQEISEAFDGNLCRCTGYKPILDAANSFVEGGGIVSKENGNAETNGTSTGSGGCCRMSNDQACACMRNQKSPNGFPLKEHNFHEQARGQSGSPVELIFPPGLKKFEPVPLFYGNERKVWFRPLTKRQLLEIKDRYPKAKLVGGATEIQIEIKMKQMDYNVSVFANDIDELKQFHYDEERKGVEFGANIDLSTLEHRLNEMTSLIGTEKSQIYQEIVKQLKYFAGRQIRNVATPAGNIATASPISDLNPVLVAADAVLTVESLSDGIQEIPISKFFIGYRKTLLPDGGIISKIFVPESLPQREVVRAFKQAKRKDDDIAIVTACLRLVVDKDFKITKARLAYGGVAPMTVRALKTEERLLGMEVSDSTSDAIISLSVNSLNNDDFKNITFGVPGGMAIFRRTLVTSFFYKFYQTVLQSFGFIRTLDGDAVEEVTRNFPIGKRDLDNAFEKKVLGKSNPHMSALKQVTGEATYVDDIPPFHKELFGVQVMSTRAHARIVSVDYSPIFEIDGVVGYANVDDIVSKQANMWGHFEDGKEEFFADGNVRYIGQCIGLVVAKDRETAARGARAVVVEYEDIDPKVITIEDAIKYNSFFNLERKIVKGDVESAFQTAAHIVEGTTRIGAQEHFYLETHGCIAVPEEDNEMKIYTSGQAPNATQVSAAQVLGIPANRIVARVKRLGGGFGGKESRCCQISSIAAVAARKFKKPVRIILTRSEDMLTMGQRHPFLIRWKVGLDKNFRFIGLKSKLYANAGWSLDLTAGVVERALFHMDNCYDFQNCHFEGFACKTNTASNTAFRGFGGPQGMFGAESLIYEVAETLGIEPDTLRELNYFRPGSSTAYQQPMNEDFTVPLLAKQVKEQANFQQLRAEVDAFNKEHKWIKRGLAHVPTAFGVSFGALFLNQAGALIHIYEDGSVLLAHGGTEMGQGLFTKMAMVAAEELDVPLESVFTSESATNTVANASPTAASASSDLNGMAVKDACDQLNKRLKPYREKFGPEATMKELAHAAYFDRVNLSANGFYKTPDIGYVWGDPNPKPAFFYHTQGAAVSMVEVNTLTGDWSCLRTDIKMDVGRPLNQAIDYGQIEGAYIQGQGLFTMEESLWLQSGALFTRGPGAYKIPGFRDIPQIFNVGILQDRPFKHLKTINRSKGIGEPPLFLGSTVFFAIRDALLAARKQNGKTEPLVGVQSPLTSERIRNLCGDSLVDLSIQAVQPTMDQKEFFVVA